MYTLLHISDLHRSPDDQVSNDELISSLIADKDQYAIGSASITGPNAIVVSGDLVHGSPLGSSEYPQDLEDQYRVAFEFLNELAERFVDGDHSRVIIVPGNHDVDWNVSLQAMVEVANTHAACISSSPDKAHRLGGHGMKGSCSKLTMLRNTVSGSNSIGSSSASSIGM